MLSTESAIASLESSRVIRSFCFISKDDTCLMLQILPNKYV